MGRHTLVNETAYSKSSRAKKINDQQAIRSAVSSRKLKDDAQHQIKLLIDRNASLQRELMDLAHKEAQTRHLAYHDGLTGLPNRNLLEDRFRQFMCQAERHHKPLALLMVDLDEFKHVNDKLGHGSGDKLLQAVAQRLSKGIRGADTACRYGGDEFVVMLPEIDSPTTAAALAVEIGGRLSEPYLIDGHKINMAVSVGVAVYPGDGQTFEALIKNADIAMYRTKGMGHSTSITVQAEADIGPRELHNPLPAHHPETVRARDLFIQDECVTHATPSKRFQNM